ncbi:alpha-keto acid decarboxylase family protein [Alkalicoccus chagannorensis]|uniref:alpha-keto acid decarboxylase family protein n=1 Tax=Alkalicoccus chagannorensis TaxID=427072 RepID=UPI000424F436|nr:thiamine pyrophosphate-binding protein [Alkalicoccus chagannorensis]
MKKITVRALLFDALRDAGILDVFGVPGDYNFALFDELETRPDLRMIVSRNELNAGYSADGYARIKGASALLTTFGVGDLSAANAMAGAASESIPIIHVVGSPPSSTQEANALAHHTLMNGDFDVFRRIHSELSAEAVQVTPENAAETIPRVIQLALEQRQPVYLDIPQDTAKAEIDMPEPTFPAPIEAKHAEKTADWIHESLRLAENPVLLVDMYTSRFGLEDAVTAFSRHYQLPTAQTLQGKSAFPEQDKQYIGMYGGRFGPEDVREQVEGADLLLTAGLLLSDFNTAKFTADLPDSKRIDLQPFHTSLFGEWIEGAPAAAVLDHLLDKENVVRPPGERHVQWHVQWHLPEETAPLRAASYYPLIEDALSSDDLLVVETGSFSYGMPYVQLPPGARMLSQGSWQSIGYALPAAVGAAAAAPETRCWCFIGDGSFQLTVQELSALQTEGLSLTIVLLNNSGYSVERNLHPARPHAAYNDIPSWDYKRITEAFVPDAETITVRRAGELQEVLERPAPEGVRLIEMMVEDAEDAPPHLRALNDYLQTDS